MSAEMDLVARAQLEKQELGRELMRLDEAVKQLRLAVTGLGELGPQRKALVTAVNGVLTRADRLELLRQLRRELALTD